MTGGLIQLVANEHIESYIIDNPEITLFKTVFRRHTPFSIESIPHSIKAAFGQTTTCNILNKGDLIHRLILAVDIPELKPHFPNTRSHDLKTLVNSVELDDIEFRDQLRAADVRQIVNLLQTKTYTDTHIIKTTAQTKQTPEINLHKINYFINRLVKDIPLVIMRTNHTFIDPSFEKRFNQDDISPPILRSIAYHIDQLFNKYQLPETVHGAYLYRVPEPTSNPLCNRVTCLNVLYFHTFQRLELLDPSKISDYLGVMYKLQPDAIVYAKAVMNLLRINVRFYCYEFSKLLTELFTHSPHTETMANYSPQARHHTIDGISVNTVHAYSLVFHRAVIPTIDQMFEYMDTWLQNITFDKVREYFDIEYCELEQENLVIRLLRQLYQNIHLIIQERTMTAEPIIQDYLNNFMYNKETLIPKYQSTPFGELNSIRFYYQAERVYVTHISHWLQSLYDQLDIKIPLSYYKLELDRYKGKAYDQTPYTWRFGEPFVPVSRFDHNQIDPIESYHSPVLIPMTVTESELYNVDATPLIDYQPEVLSTQTTKTTTTRIDTSKFKEQLQNLRQRVAELFDRHDEPRCAWIQRLGHYLIKSCTLKIGGRTIDRHESDWLEITSRETVCKNREYAYNKMIGHTPDLYTYDTKPKPKRTLFIPLQFYFCQETSQSLPLVSSPHVQIDITFRKLSDLAYIEPYGICRPDNLKATMYTEYIFLSKDERTLFATKRLEYLIDQIQTHRTSETNIEYPFTNPTKVIKTIIQPTSHITSKGHYYPNEKQYANYNLLPWYDHTQLRASQLKLFDAIQLDPPYLPSFELNIQQDVRQLIRNQEHLIRQRLDIPIELDIVNDLVRRIYQSHNLEYDLIIETEMFLDEIIELIMNDLRREIDRAVVTREAILTTIKSMYHNYYICWASYNAHTEQGTIEPLQISYKNWVYDTIGMFTSETLLDLWNKHIDYRIVQDIVNRLEQLDEKQFDSIRFRINRDLPKNPEIPTLKSRSLYLDNELLDTSDYVKALTHSYPSQVCPGTSSYQFALLPNRSQPSGSVNLSRVKLKAEYDTYPDCTITTFSKSLNLIRYMGKQAFVTWQ